MSLIIVVGTPPIWSDSEPPAPHVNVVDDTNSKRLIAVARFDGVKAMDHAATFIDAATRIAWLEAELDKANSAFETAAAAGAELREKLESMKGNILKLVIEARKSERERCAKAIEAAPGQPILKTMLAATIRAFE